MTEQEIILVVRSFFINPNTGKTDITQWLYNACDAEKAEKKYFSLPDHNYSSRSIEIVIQDKT